MKNSIYLFIRIFLCSLAGIFISQVSFAQHWEWAKGITGTDGGYAVTTDHFANVYVTGRFSGSTFTFGLQTFTNRGNFTDIYVAKFDSSGSILWVKSAGSNDMDVSKAIATDTSGNVYVAGTFESQMMVFGTDTLRNPVGDPRIFILKYDAAGNELHGFCESSGSSDDPSGIACDKSGNLYLTGELMTSDITFGSMTVHNIAVGQDVFLFKFDGNGTPLWAAGIRGDNYDFSTGLAVDKDANVIVSGYFKSDTLWIGSDTLVNVNGGIVGQNDIFLAKFDSSGVPQWSKSTGGHLSEYNYAVETDDAGNILTTGYYFSSSLIFGNDTLLNNGSGFSDLFLTKYDPQGNVMWAKKAYGTRSESGYSVSTDPMQNVFMTGYFASPTLRFDTNNILNNHNPTASNQSGFDGFVVKYDGQGNILWSDCIGGTNYDFGADIFGDASGNQYVTGLYNSNTITFGSTVLPTGGNTNMFIAKLSGDMITQVPDLSQADQLTIYPNPSTGKFAIEGLAPGDSYALYSVGGQLLQKQTASSDNSEVDLRNYPKGIYFLSVAQGKKVLHRKLIRE